MFQSVYSTFPGLYTDRETMWPHPRAFWCICLHFFLQVLCASERQAADHDGAQLEALFCALAPYCRRAAWTG